MIRRLARPMLATVFVIDGVETFRHPQRRVDTAAPLVDKAAPLVEKGEKAVNERVSASVPPVTKDTETLVKVLAGVKIGAGVTFALGKAPRLSAVALTASHLPSTVSRNAFWAESDPGAKSRKTTGLATDVALLGALLLASADTDGQPGLAWRARKTSDKVSDRLPGAKAETAAAGGAITGAAHSVADQARDRASGFAGIVRSQAPVVAARLRDRAEAAREQAAPLAAQAREQAAPLAAQAREQAAPLTAQARERAGVAAQVAAEQAGQARGVARDRAEHARDVAAARAADVDTGRMRKTADVAGSRAKKRTDRARRKVAKSIRP